MRADLKKEHEVELQNLNSQIDFLMIQNKKFEQDQLL
jgi:hypothetical protein